VFHRGVASASLCRGSSGSGGRRRVLGLLDTTALLYIAGSAVVDVETREFI
jgi:hypothetical protein